jgi:small subunit ribosomal protein S3
MANKVHPNAFRLSVNRDWKSVWFAEGDQYKEMLKQDARIRDCIRDIMSHGMIERIDIKRSRGDMKIFIYSGKPGVVIGRAGSGIEQITEALNKRVLSGQDVDLNINVKEVKKTGLSARVLALQIAEDIERRRSYRRGMKMAIERAQKANAEGVRISVAGRLNGGEIARTETLSDGSIPLQNLRADIDYAYVLANTTYGAIGVKVWVNRGEVFDMTKQKRSKK